MKSFNGKRAAYARALVDALENALADSSDSAVPVDQLVEWTEKAMPDCYKGSTTYGNGGGSAIRRAVNDAIAKLGVPVIAAPSGGYFIASSEYQVSAEVDSLVGRAHALLARAVAVRAAYSKQLEQSW